MSKPQLAHFVKTLQGLLEETFEHVHGFYLDGGTSLFETLATLTAEQASIPLGTGEPGHPCATLAAKVKHVAFYLDVIDQSVRDPSVAAVDWSEIWRTVGAVTPEEWLAIQLELHQAYSRILKCVNEPPSLPSEDQLEGLAAVIAHTAFHLGEIRQALCILR